MKTILLSFICFITLAFAMGQNVPRSFVVMEDGTGTWCQYCPGAAMGCDDMLSNGKNVAVIANHNGDTYANTYSNTRNTMWGISAYPSVSLDGSFGSVGGSHTASMYTTYLPMYNQAIAVTSPISLDMSVTNTGLNYTAVITVTKSGTVTSSSNILYFFVTQSKIVQSWQGQTHLEHVNRLMAPDQNGTAITFPSGNVQTVTLNFTMNSAWPLQNCEFITFVQDKDAGQGNIPGTSPYPLKMYTVYNCIKKGVVDLTADFTADVTSIPMNGTVTFTDASFGGFIGVPRTYNWTFPGGTPSTSTAASPSVVYSECGPHDVILEVTNGGEVNTTTKIAYIMVGPLVNVYSTPNDTACSYQPITLFAYPANATYLWSPGGATTQSIVLDAATVGLGSHTYSVDVTADGCTNTKTQTIVFDACTGIPAASNEVSASIYPNPNHGAFRLELSTGKSGLVDISILNSLGSTVYNESHVAVNGSLVKNIDLKNLTSGVYFMVIQTGEKKIVRKIFIN